MLAKHSTGSENGVIRRYDILSYDRSIADKNSTRTRRPERARDLADVSSLPAVTVAATAADCQKTGFWSSVINYLMEGFALCGASLHPAMFSPVELHPDERKITTARDISLRNWRGPVYLDSPAASEATASAGFDRNTDQIAPAGLAVAFADHSWREREREIEKAVAALARLDDRTLRDLGIPHRSSIEQTVRYCHDC